MKNPTSWVKAMDMMRCLVGGALSDGTYSPAEHQACLLVIEAARANVDDVEEPVPDDVEYDELGEPVF